MDVPFTNLRITPNSYSQLTNLMTPILIESSDAGRVFLAFAYGRDMGALAVVQTKTPTMIGAFDRIVVHDFARRKRRGAVGANIAQGKNFAALTAPHDYGMSGYSFVSHLPTL